MALLRGAPAAPRLGAGRAAQAADADTIVDLIPTLCNLSARERDVLAAHAVVIGVPSGTAIVRRGEKSDKAYFIMAGRAVAGFEDTDGSFRVLNPLLAGDFFGEIAALTGSARTADVVADENVQIMQVPAATLREMMSNAQFSSLVLETMTSRLNVVSSTVLPRFAALDQSDLRDLRTNAAEAS
jgi:CRP-like cAMP-binding protein